MTTAPADPSGPSDAELIAAVREGRLESYGPLYERHVSAAYNLARQLARSSTEADDLVSEAFSKVLDALRAGKGPDSAFRAYLLTALRHTAYDKTRKDKRVDLSDDMTAMTTGGGAAAEALTVPFSDTAMAGLERTLAAKAFARLPERWQAVLWHTEIEQQSPAEVAPLLGLTPNGVSALAYRAREGLRQAYLQVHLAEVSADRCRATADKLGAWTRSGLSKRERAQVEQHLDECADCRALAAELADVNGALRAIVAPLVLGGGVLGYLALAGAGKASAATAIGAGAAAGSAGGAASAAASGPRQFVGVAASGVAMAAAIAVALTAGGQREIPAAAAPPPPPAVQAPANPPAVPPAPPAAPPAPEPPAPAPPPVVPPPPAQQPAPQEPAPPPAPAPPGVTAESPADGIALDPGGDPVDLPITVRNDGGSVSEPVAVTLNLPEGVSAIGPASGGGGAPASGPVARQAPQAERVTCPGGTGTVTCRTQEGLEPGESAVLVFRLQAAADAVSGQITGTVNSGSPVEVSIRVPVRVAPVQDAVFLKVDPAFHPWGRMLSVQVRNDGPLAREATMTVDEAAHASPLNRPARCDRDGDSVTCRSTHALEPGETIRFWVVVRSHFLKEKDVTVTATVGSASTSETVEIKCLGHWCHWPDRPGKNRPTPTATPEPAPSAPATPSTTTGTTTTPPAEPAVSRWPGPPTSPEPPTTPELSPPSQPERSKPRKPEKPTPTPAPEHSRPPKSSQPPPFDWLGWFD
ncbi:sigma-70 family RNA polymerase sigma factor [Prauserella flavalba]|uniref:RNA polymerase subunit sigma n=1 Tax=Prauserella flavalba TaxID=1477506 RepID=A0A318LXU6_9PSEU|nr:sigma-70 family RNA polymerase sigma factor [Prauserella flavalba]PXY37299.1 RNA polymerase subunit sigma [Prauserella flavalba]